MVLRAKKPNETQEKPYRLKLFIFGAEKIGKTTAALQFPNAYIIDSEGATEYPQYRKLISDANSASVIIRDFDNLYENVKYLMTNKHEFKTLVIDSLSPIYTKLVEDAENSVGTGFGKAHGVANKKFKQLMNLIMELDMNVVATSHARTEYMTDGSVNPMQTYDCYKKMGYCFTTIAEIQKRGNRRIMSIRGSWLENFKDGDNFEFSYAEITKRFPIDVINRDVQIVESPDISYIMEVQHLIEKLKVPPETVKLWLNKANAETFDDMKIDDLLKLITYLKSKETSNV